MRFTFLHAALLLTVAALATPAALAAANPASVNCSKKGGTLVILKDAAGNEYGLCKFSDGAMIEEWTLFRRSHKKH
jgi:putative hemolysin